MKLGFYLNKIIPPTYYYIKNKKRYIKEIFENSPERLNFFNEKLSIKQNILNNGYNIIYDCGYYEFIKKYKI